MSNIIIGGGITGLYLAYKLKKLHPDCPLTIIEKTNRLGGRILTKTKNNHKIDIGAGRFSENHKLIKEVIKDMGLEKDLIKLPKKKHYYVNDKLIKTDKELLHHYKVKRFKTISQMWNHVTDIIDEFDDSKLINLTVHEVLYSILNKNEVEVLIKSYLYNTKIFYSNALTAFRSIIADYDVLGDEMYILKGGMEKLVKKLEDHLVKNDVDILLLHDVEVIHKTCITVSHEGTKFSIKYKNLFLCVTRFDVLNFKGLFNKKDKTLISKSLNTSSLMRMYAEYPVKNNKSWFSDLPKILADNKMQFIIPINPKKGLIMITYSSDKIAEYWNKVGNKKEVEDEIHEILDKMFPDRKIPRPKWLTVHYWKKAVHYWNVGHDPKKIEKVLNKFDNIHILGEAFSYRQAWMEGGAEMAQNLIDKGVSLTKTPLSKIPLKTKGKKQKYDDLPIITKKELKKHNTKDDIWSSIKDPKTKITFVYDFTKWAWKHPGGSAHIVSIAGKDATKKFYGQKSHPIEKIETFIFPIYRIGLLE